MDIAKSLTRYEVEIQLGATDESHLIRTIEYWDIERRCYPQYEHVAVIAAEDVPAPRGQWHPVIRYPTSAAGFS